MKNVFLILFMLAFVPASFTACTPEDKAQNELQTDPDENCPPNDTNCNGIPDNQENN